MAYDAAQAERIRALLGKRADLTEKEMFGGLAFLLGGNMAIAVSDRGLLVRVPPEQHAKLLKERGARDMDMGRGPMPGWLRVGPEGFATEAGLRRWVERGAGYAGGLPKKATKAHAKNAARKRRSWTVQNVLGRFREAPAGPAGPRRPARAHARER